MSYSWFFLAVAVAAVASAVRAQRQLGGYRSEIRRLKESVDALQSRCADSERFDALLSSMHESLFRLDGSGNVVAANAAACDLFEIDARDLPRPLRQFYRDADWHESLKDAMACLPEHAQLPNMLHAGHVLAPRLVQPGDAQVMLICMDVTEQDRLERQRRTFISNLLHDLKTPLTSLLGYARSLESFGDDRALRNEAAQVIADETKYVNRLLDALLTLDQIEFAIREPDAECGPKAVLAQVCDTLKPQLSAGGVRLNCEGEEKLNPVAMAAHDLERVFVNVLENAAQHSPANGTIRVRLREHGQTCLVEIEDEGAGIPEKKLARVTERFYRVDKARSRSGGGHGLGLAIVKELLDAHDGTLKLSNVSPHGLRVEIALPLTRMDFSTP
jgi:two-component system phosphate regulon sensor histidine kinase PhoR